LPGQAQRTEAEIITLTSRGLAVVEKPPRGQTKLSAISGQQSAIKASAFGRRFWS
jgi:hypothetical protein